MDNARTLRLSGTSCGAAAARRPAAFRPLAPACRRGCGRLLLERATQAYLRCDFDFLRGGKR